MGYSSKFSSLIHTYMSCCLYNVAGSRPRANDDAAHEYICRADFNNASIDGPPASIQYVPCIREHQHAISVTPRAVLKLEWEVVSRHIKWFHLLSFRTNSRCRAMLPSRCRLVAYRQSRQSNSTSVSRLYLALQMHSKLENMQNLVAEEA